MGISGLLPLLRSSITDGNVDEFKGQTVAIDSYCWLHKAAYMCPIELLEGKIPPSFTNYSRRRIEMLLSHGVKPLMVFDGQNLPSKACTEEERRRSRETNRAMGAQLLREGKKKQANEYFQKCINITPEIAYSLIELCQQMGVDYLVAPYEADAQMAYLWHTGAVQGIITEDSDLIAFGCDRILFKMDATGKGQFFDRQKLKDPERAHEVDLTTWDDLSILRMCILSGCDYLPSIHGIGLKKAYQLLLRNQNDVKMVIRALRLKGQAVVPPDYLAHFQRAEHTFHHQRVYDRDTGTCCPLTPFPEEGSPDDLPYETRNVFIGPPITDSIAKGIATGHLNPLTLKPMKPTHNQSISVSSSGYTRSHKPKDNIENVPPVTATTPAFKNYSRVKNITHDKSSINSKGNQSNQGNKGGFQWPSMNTYLVKKQQTCTERTTRENQTSLRPSITLTNEHDSFYGSSQESQIGSSTSQASVEDIPAPELRLGVNVTPRQSRCVSRFFFQMNTEIDSGPEDTEGRDLELSQDSGWGGTQTSQTTPKETTPLVETGYEEGLAKRNRPEADEHEHQLSQETPNALALLKQFRYKAASKNPPKRPPRVGLSRPSAKSNNNRLSGANMATKVLHSQSTNTSNTPNT
eukprot:Ihof_evm23s11 gene=Ihof_evmTU23s11